MRKTSDKMSINQIEASIGNAKRILNYSLDELEYVMSKTPRYKVDRYITEHYNNKDKIAYQCYHTNRIEGSVVTLTDTDRIINGSYVDNDKYSIKDINEVKGFVNAYRRSVRYLRDSTITVPIIKDLHKNLMIYTDPKIAGIYRKGDATIYGKEDFIRFVSPSKIDMMLSRAIEAYNIGITKAPTLFEACKFKINFINIHPFSDGNGRTSRILLNCMLISGGMIPIIITDAERMGYKRAMQIGYQCCSEGIPCGHFPLMVIVVNGLINGYKNILGNKCK